MKVRIRWSKYAAIYTTSLSNQWAYVLETTVNSVFLIVIMFIFVNLWTTTYTSTHNRMLAGYTVRDIVWYLAMTEAIMMGSPRLVNRLSQEIKEGDIAYRLTRPLHYISYYFCDYVGEASARMLINLCVGGLVALLFFGVPPCSWLSLVIFVPAVLLALSLQFFMNMSICLLLFWIEDGRGLELILTRAVMIFGGMMIPLPLFPAWLKQICNWLPFQIVSYFPAKTFVSVGTQGSVPLFMEGTLWLIVFILISLGLYRTGVRRLNVQGG